MTFLYRQLHPRLHARTSTCERSANAHIYINHSGVKPVFKTIVYGRMWVRGRTRYIASPIRVRTTAISSRVHHNRAPRTKCQHAQTQPYHTRLFVHASARPMHTRTPECMWIVHGGCGCGAARAAVESRIRVRIAVTSSRVHHKAPPPQS